MATIVIMADPRQQYSLDATRKGWSLIKLLQGMKGRTQRCQHIERQYRRIHIRTRRTLAHTRQLEQRQTPTTAPAVRGRLRARG